MLIIMTTAYINQYNNVPKVQLSAIIIFHQRNNIFTYIEIFALYNTYSQSLLILYNAIDSPTALLLMI